MVGRPLLPTELGICENALGEYSGGGVRMYSSVGVVGTCRPTRGCLAADPPGRGGLSYGGNEVTDRSVDIEAFELVVNDDCPEEALASRGAVNRSAVAPFDMA